MLVWSARNSSCCLYTSEGSTVTEREKQKKCSGRQSFGARLTTQEGWCHQRQWQVPVPSLQMLGRKQSPGEHWMSLFTLVTFLSTKDKSTFGFYAFIRGSQVFKRKKEGGVYEHVIHCEELPRYTGTSGVTLRWAANSAEPYPILETLRYSHRNLQWSNFSAFD